MKKNSFKKILLVIFIFIFSFFSKINSFIKADSINYIYLDLNCDNVVIDASTYSGCVFKTVDGVTTSLSVSGNHSASNHYYVYQSNSTNKSLTGLIDETEKISLPIYSSLNETILSFINNTDVEGVIKKFKNDALGVGREATSNRISITGSSTFDVVVDNLWSSFQTNSTSRKDGGISFLPSSVSKAIIRLKGENRFGNIFYQNTENRTTLEITSNDGVNETTGSLVVANINSNSSYNHYNSGIGASDTGDHAVGINITGGTIYVGTNMKDNCTAIGGGGNGRGYVNIHGGIITAVSNSTGTAIGGGIGESSYGGDASVKITGGVIYAYNLGYVYSGNGTFIPGVAIGGGSSRLSNGNKNTTIEITGGVIYAQSVGGVAIGGGNSASLSGGPANILISGDAKVTADSVSGSYTYNGATYQIFKGSGIGGGTGGKNGNGGAATVNISCGEIVSGTIGGGETNSTSLDYSVGDAYVEITGGEITGRVLMYNGTFNISGGLLSGGISENGGCVQMYSGEATISGGEIKNCEATKNGGAIYLAGGNFYASGGKISNNKAESGAGVYIVSGTFEMLDGSINNNESSLNGGGIEIGGSGSFTMNGGSINNNISLNGNGGGIYVASGNIIMNDGIIENNTAKNGGGFYLTKGTFEIRNGSLITKNKALNGAGGYVNSGTFNLTGGTTSNNIAQEFGGGYYIVDTETANLTNGIIKNNEAKNGGGFYQTQTNGNTTSTTLSGTCYVNNNLAKDGNGGGIYVDGGSTFRIINGKVIYNKATGTPGDTDLKSSVYVNNQETNEKIVYAKDSTGGVGGGVYLKHGIFTMKDMNGLDGNAAIFGNTATYAADDLFANGDNLTTFDAIPVITMEKDDSYIYSTDWYEDYPKGEYHKSLKISDNSNYLTSNDRYKNIINENQLVKADSVLSTSQEYICITMGANVGSIYLNILDPYVGSDSIFIYNLKDNNLEVDLKISVKQGKTTKITNVPIGNYQLILNDKWSFRYTNLFTANILKGEENTLLENQNTINFQVVGGQTVIINTKYNIKNKKYLTKNLFTKATFKYNNIIN